MSTDPNAAIVLLCTMVTGIISMMAICITCMEAMSTSTGWKSGSQIKRSARRVTIAVYTKPIMFMDRTAGTNKYSMEGIQIIWSAATCTIRMEITATITADLRPPGND